MKKFAVTAVFILILAAVSLFWIYRQKSALPSDVVRIAINPWPGYEYLYLAEQKGFFKEEGLSIALKQFSSLEDVRLAFERGQIDGMCTTLIEILQAWANTGKTARIALISDYSNGADVILAKHPSKSPADLKGKKIGVEPMTLGAFVLQRALEKAELSRQDVTVFGYSQLQMKEAIVKGEIDAAVAYPPMSIEIEKLEGMNKIFDSTQIPKEVLDVISFKAELLEKHPAFVPALRRIWDKALDYAKNHPDESIALMAAREGITPSEFSDALSGIKVLSVAEQIDIIGSGLLAEDISRTEAVLKTSGDLEKDMPAPGIFIHEGR